MTERKSMKAAAIILAAGSSSRMGRSKQQLDIHGEKLLVKTVQTVLDAGIHAVVVLGADEKAHRAILDDMPVEIVSNANWARGIGSSLKAGLRYLTSKNADIQYTLVLVCDQPLLNRDHILALISRYQSSEKPIIASRYSKMPGVPVLFDAAYFPSLMNLPDDSGAKKIIVNHPADVSEVDFPGGEFDLDTAEDFENFMSRPPIA
jgi:molybdenum cofactor cytidylyltransferase